LFLSHKTPSNILKIDLFLIDNIAMYLSATSKDMRYIKIKYCFF